MKKILKIIKGNILGFIIGAILFGCIGTVVATTILSSTVSYTNNNQTTVEGALNDLYNRVITSCYNGSCGKLSYKYWNAGGGGTSYGYDSLPDDLYPNRELLALNSPMFSSHHYYIRTVFIDNSFITNQVCLWFNNREFCLYPNYWAGNLGVSSTEATQQTAIILKRDLEQQLNITNVYCTPNTNEAYCNINNNNIHIKITYNGEILISKSGSGQDSCGMFNDGFAYCMWI